MQKEPSLSELCKILSESVGSAVDNALRSAEVQEIKQAVKEVVKEVTNELTDELTSQKEKIKATRVRVYQTPPPTPSPAAAPAPVQSTGLMVLPKRLQKLKIKGNATAFCGVMGASASVGFLVLSAVSAFTAITTSLPTGIALAVFSILPLGACAAFGLLVRRGIQTYGMAARYPQYVAAIGPNRLCPIKVLAQAVGKPEAFVKDELKRMLAAKLFPQGWLDEAEGCLILDNETYWQYKEAQEKMNQSRREAEPEPEAEPETPKTELEQALTEGREYIRRMRLANDLIENELISDKIDRIDAVCHRIFDLVEQYPEKLPDIRRLMSYYLPITLKLLEGYCKFDNQPVQGENIITAKKEIEDTLDTIILAFENLLDSLFQREAMDLSSDISALEAMLAQEGLTGSDFKKTTEAPK